MTNLEKSVEDIAIKIKDNLLDINKAQFIIQLVELIQNHLNLHFVGLYTFNSNQEIAILKAGSGELGKLLLSMKHQLYIKESWIKSLVSSGEPRIKNNINFNVFNYAIGSNQPKLLTIIFEFQGTPPARLLPETTWQLFLPCRKDNEVVAILEFHKNEETIFSLEEVTNFQKLADIIGDYLAISPSSS